MPQLGRFTRLGLTFAVFAAVALGAGLTAKADNVTIVTGNCGPCVTDNVLFNDGSLNHSGLVVQGNFSGAGTGFIVDFTSTSGTGNLIGNGGQARVDGGTGNAPFTNVAFQLENGATFTTAVFNPDVFDAAGDGTATITVFGINFTNPGGSPFAQTFTVSANGSNFFTVEAVSGAVITKIVISSSNTSFDNLQQVRIGGFAAASVPEPASMILLGTGLIGAAAGIRRRRARK